MPVSLRTVSSVPFDAAARVRRVDAVADRRLARAVDVDDQVAREREHRDRLRVRVGADQHQRVGARGLRVVAEAVVVADDQRDGGLVRDRQVEHLLGLDHVLGRRPQVLDGLVEPEVAAAGRREPERERPRAASRSGCARPRRARAAGRRRLLVARDRADRAGREDRAPVAVAGRRTPDAALERRFQRGPSQRIGAHSAAGGARQGRSFRRGLIEAKPRPGHGRAARIPDPAADDQVRTRASRSFAIRFSRAGSAARSRARSR